MVWTFWPFKDEPPDNPTGPESEYGPIRSDTVHDVVAGSEEDARSQLPAPPPGCHWGLVGWATEEVAR